MPILRFNTEPKLSHIEKALEQLRHRLPLAYLKPRTGKNYMDFMLDINDDAMEELRTWLLYCGWDTEVAQ
jgi:hypothetical protein